MPMGPIELADAVGLDIWKNVANILSKNMDTELQKNLQHTVDAGLLGKKTVSGLYKYEQGKVKKNKEVSKFLHPSDWFFVIWLFLMSITAFAVRIFVDTGLIENNIWLFLVHIILFCPIPKPLIKSFHPMKWDRIALIG